MAQALPGFGLRAGYKAVPASSSPSALRSFVAAANERERIEGLPDDLNPGILDPEKVVHLASALPRLEAATLARLAGNELYLDTSGMQVRAAYPSRPESFDRPFTLEIDEIQGKTVLARVSLPPDLDLARSRARDAAARLHPLEEEVARIEQAGGGEAGPLRLAKERRLAAAQVWRVNAAAWAQAAPGDPDAKEAAAASDAAASAYGISSRDGTPGG